MRKVLSRRNYHWWSTKNGKFDFIVDLTSWRIGINFSSSFFSIHFLCLEFSFNARGTY